MLYLTLTGSFLSPISLSLSLSMDGPVRANLLLLLLFFSASVFSPSIQAQNVEYCDKKGNYAVKVQGIEISPDPVEPGKPANFNILASTGQAISGGKLVIEVFYFGVHVRTEKHDLCEESSCPISAGKFVISHNQTLPAYTPPGTYTLKVKMKDANKHKLTCIGFKFKIGVGSFVSDS